jgi:hypothetical protein
MNDFVEVFIFTHSKDAIFSKYIFQVVIGFAALLWGLYLFRKARREKGETLQFLIVGFVLLWSVVWISTNSISLYSYSQKYSQIMNIYNNHSYSVAEGNVKIIPPPSSYYKGEFILVDGIEFEINDYTESFGYHKTTRNGGVLKDGASVRLTYFKDVTRYETKYVIIRVQVLKTE